MGQYLWLIVDSQRHHFCLGDRSDALSDLLRTPPSLKTKRFQVPRKRKAPDLDVSEDILSGIINLPHKTGKISQAGAVGDLAEAHGQIPLLSDAIGKPRYSQIEVFNETSLSLEGVNYVNCTSGKLFY